MKAVRLHAATSAILISLLPAAVCGQPVTAGPPLSAEKMWQMQRVGDPALSPDGRTAVVSIIRWDVEKNASTGDLHAFDVDTGEARRLTADDGVESEPAWSPDGRWLAFVAKRGDDRQSQIYVLPANGGEAQRLTNIPSGVSGIKWFGDSRRIAFITRVWTDLATWEAQAARLREREEQKLGVIAWDKPRTMHWDRFLDDREAHVYAVSITGGVPVALTLGTGEQLSRKETSRASYDLAPDATEIAFAADVDRTGVAENYDIFVAPIGGAAPGSARNLTAENPADDSAPLYSPDGRRLAYLSQRIRGFYGDRQRLQLLDRQRGEVTELARDWDRSAGGLAWSPDSRALYGAIDDAGTQRIYRFDLRGGTPTPVTRASSYSGLAVAGKPARMVATRQSFSEPPTLVAVDLQSGEPRQLSRVNDAILAGVSLGKVESVTYRSSDGAEIQMWVNYPPGFDPSRKYPVFLILHGGPHNGVTDAWTFRWNSQVFAGWGYVSAWHNFRGSSGFGQAFTDAINPDRISKPYADTIAAADWFKSQPWTDANRMVAGGGSYGGFLAATLLGREHPFRALVAHAAVYNEFTQYGADYGAGKRRFFEFWDRPAEFAKYSPHSAAGNFRTPTLVTHGQLDYRVPVNHGFELFHTLQNRGVPSRMLYFKDENHWILKPQNSLYWYRSVREWFDRHTTQ